ncbi:MAG: MiaB/RimO family radical SAM methylthiotransferase [Chloroflexi bacterium]|nr:MiaB/RimO family radical SAM methylthiotransferase [Chloroflexota bacterium]
MGEGLAGLGLARAATAEDADLVVMTTCVVRQSAEGKVLGRLHSLRSWRQAPASRALVVIGCFVDDPIELAHRFPWVDRFLAPSDLEGVMAFARQWLDGQGASASVDRRALPTATITDAVPISYGCDHHCTYCIVTLRRGSQQSRPIPEIAAQVRDLVTRGAREITLLGQNVDAYGTDLPGHPDLADILLAIHDIEGLWRIRFLTSHPSEMTQRIIDTASSLPKVCESWELPVQSGDDAVLRRMGRGYSVAQFLDLVARIRAASLHCAIATDVIVGFPGETAAQFENTMHLLARVRFDVVHIAAYSVREGTPAARLADDVPAEEKRRRRELVEELQAGIAAEINARLMGESVEILVDGWQRGRWRGRTRTNKLVFFEDDADWLGRLVSPTITWTGPWSLIGRLGTPEGERDAGGPSGQA